MKTLVLVLVLWVEPRILLAQEPAFELLGVLTLPSSQKFSSSEGESKVGGLSAISYRPSSDTFWLLSDDDGANGRPRMFEMRLPLNEKGRVGEKIEILKVVFLRNRKGKLWRKQVIDPEGLAWSPDERLFMASENGPAFEVDSVVAEINPAGRLLSYLPLPQAFDAKINGVWKNLGLESLAIAPSGRYLFTANEDALRKDGPKTSRELGATVRLVRLDLEKIDQNQADSAETFFYPIDPIPHQALLPLLPAVNGLVELLALSDNDLLALERAYAWGQGNDIRLYRVRLDGQKPLRKQFLLNFTDLPIVPDNYEGMTFGPKLADGRQSLVFVSDNNFNRFGGQYQTRFVVLAADFSILMPE